MGVGMMTFGLLMMLIGTLILGAIVALIVWAVHRFADHGNRAAGGDAARQILDERYARGEIGLDDYQRAKRELS